jgi:hypothetical protein
MRGELKRRENGFLENVMSGGYLEDVWRTSGECMSRKGWNVLDSIGDRT